MLGPSTEDAVDGRVLFLVGGRWGWGSRCRAGGRGGEDGSLPGERQHDRRRRRRAIFSSRAPTRSVGWLSAAAEPIGYYKDPEKSARTFIIVDGKRYSCPGDYATMSTLTGPVKVLGRGSVCINSGGEKIFPEEVEEALKTQRLGRRRGCRSEYHTIGSARWSSAWWNAGPAWSRTETELIEHVRVHDWLPTRPRGESGRGRHDRPCGEWQGRLQAAARPGERRIVTGSTHGH